MLNPVSEAFLQSLRDRLPPATFREVSAGYLEEPRGKWHGQAGAVLAPATVDEAAEIIRAAGAARVGVVPYAGGTGLVAGQLAPEGPAPVVVSLERMRAVRTVFPEENVIVAEAGATLAEVQAAARDAGRMFPLSYASEGTARIGGALSVNSGGLGVLRYGMARDLCLGLEVVLPDGQIWHGLTRLRKDNTGYDLRDLLIGAEGTLGLITAAALRLVPEPRQRATALLIVPGAAAALSLLSRAGEVFGEAVSAFEFISGTGLTFLAETGLGPRGLFDHVPDWMVLIEIGASGAGDAEAGLETLFAAAHEAGEVSDGIVASSEAQRAELWAMRETIPEANRVIGAIASHDISLPLSEIPEFLDETGAALAALDPTMRLNAFGHLGDGNLHYNLFPAVGRRAADYASVTEDVTRLVHDAVVARGGSFSAEHGIGRFKVGELERYGDPAKLAAMRAIKGALDPLGIMNPGAVLRVREDR